MVRALPWRPHALAARSLSVDHFPLPSTECNFHTQTGRRPPTI